MHVHVQCMYMRMLILAVMHSALKFYFFSMTSTMYVQYLAYCIVILQWWVHGWRLTLMSLKYFSLSSHPPSSITSLAALALNQVWMYMCMYM